MISNTKNIKAQKKHLKYKNVGLNLHTYLHISADTHTQTMSEETEDTNDAFGGHKM